MSAWYSATLLVVDADALAHCRRAASAASSTGRARPRRSPPGPGLPRAPPSLKTTTSSRRSSPSRLTAPGWSRSCRSTRSMPSGAFGCCSTSVDGIDKWQPWHVDADEARHADASRAGSHAARSRRRARRRARRDRVTGRARSADLRRRSPLRPPRAPTRARSTSANERGAPRVELGEAGVERLALLHQLELAVLERALVPSQLIDVGLHRLELLRRRHRAGVHLRLDLGRLLAERAALRRRAASPRRAISSRSPREHADLRGRARRATPRPTRRRPRSGRVSRRWSRRSSAPSCSWSDQERLEAGRPSLIGARARRRWSTRAAAGGAVAGGVVAGGAVAAGGGRGRPLLGRHRVGRRRRRGVASTGAGAAVPAVLARPVCPGRSQGPAPGRVAGCRGGRRARRLMNARKIGAAESPPKPAPATGWSVRLPNHTAVASCGCRADEPRVGAVVGGAGLAEDRRGPETSALPVRCRR